MVFGADGDRDTTKRTDMGAIAARGSDAVVITDFHPRWEDPATIRAALLEGARAAVPELELYEVPDPRAAFRKALSLAGEGDVVLYAGPGHEDYQEVAGQRMPVFRARRRAARAARGRVALMIALTLAEIAAATRGTLRARRHRRDARDRRRPGSRTTDSREVVPGTIFFAKPGEVTDGHLFAPAGRRGGRRARRRRPRARPRGAAAARRGHRRRARRPGDRGHRARARARDG